jgi:soluble cytochrome b562
MKNNLPQQRPAPLIPDGAEIWIGIGIAAIIWWFMKDHFEWWLYIPIMFLVYIFFVDGVNLLTEDYRMWAKSMKKRNSVLVNLDKVKKSVQEIQDILQLIPSDKRRQNYEAAGAPAIVAQLSDSLDISFEAIQSLDDQKRPGIAFTGYSDMLTKTTQLSTSIEECANLLANPSTGGGKNAELMKEFTAGFDGYHDWIPDMSSRAKSGDLFNARTSAILLGTLRKLMKKDN